MYVLFCFFILLFFQTFSADEFTKRKALSYKGEKRVMDLIIFLNGFLLKNYLRRMSCLLRQFIYASQNTFLVFIFKNVFIFMYMHSDG